MDEFSRIRAKTRRNRGTHLLSRVFSLAAALSIAVLAPISAALASGGHGDAPPPAEAKPPEPPPPPPPPPPRPRLPPPVLNGPIAAPAPKPRLIWLADRNTGLALGGYDPVAYWVDHHPRMGSRDLQLEWGGTTWQFASQGNLDAFRADPEVYAPLFGGRCAFAVANGHPTEGSPISFIVWRDKLLLFADPVSRTAFLEDPDRLLGEAERRWPALLDDLP